MKLSWNRKRTVTSPTRYDCSVCSNELDHAWTTCRYCGTVLNGSTKRAHAPTIKREMRRFGVLLVLLTFGVPGFASPALPARAAQDLHVGAARGGIGFEVNTFLKRLAKQHLFMGDVLLARKGTILMDKGYGFADWERHRPNAQQTKFRLASVTKQFTAMAILQLQDQGKLGVQDRACVYLADCPSAWQDVTIHQLLNHTSGVPDPFRDSIVGFYPWKYWTPEQMITFVHDMPLLFKPGTDWHYSNINYIALGLIVQKVSGVSYATFLHDHIFLPLGMTNSGLAQEGETVSNLASGYDGYSRVDSSMFDPTWSFAAGDLYSTVGDLYLWDQALTTEKLVSKRSLDMMFTPSFTFPDTSGYGYGWLIGTMAGHRVIWHDGGMPGVSTLNVIFPDDGVTLIILTNNSQTSMDVISTYITTRIFLKKCAVQPYRAHCMPVVTAGM
jgi:CubicO group peptidase (beta-lactamase class C family)